MRNLNNKDLFMLMRIMRKADIKNKLVQMDLPKDENGSLKLSEEQFGTMMILEVIESAPAAEKDIFAFLADIGGVDIEEIENDEFELLPKVIDHLKGQKKFIYFLEQAFKSTNSRPMTQSSSATMASPLS